MQRAGRSIDRMKTGLRRRSTPILAGVLSVALFAATAAPLYAQTAGKKPNILVIWGDDIGWYNPSIYHRGDMGYWTPNIDRIGKEGAMFTSWYGQQSCTAGRAAFITGQSPIRTGLTKVGLPGADIGLRPEDPTIAEILKPLGYATGQFGKNHLGDKDEFLPTNHGFDEFFGNLYHLNAEEEPENVDYPKNPEFRKRFGPRGVLHSYAGGKIEDTGPLTKKRMETVDEEFLGAAPRLHRPPEQGRQAVLRLVQQHAHARLHAPEARVAGQDGPRSLSRRHGRARRPRRAVAQEARRARDRGQHDRRVRHRQRRRGDVVAGRRHDTRSGREGDELGGRLPNAVPDPLAWRHQARHHLQRHVRARGPAADLRGRRGRYRTSWHGA